MAKMKRPERGEQKSRKPRISLATGRASRKLSDEDLKGLLADWDKPDAAKKKRRSTFNPYFNKLVEIGLTPKQLDSLTYLFQELRVAASLLGKELAGLQRDLENEFNSDDVSTKNVVSLMGKIALARLELRFAQLETELKSLPMLGKARDTSKTASTPSLRPQLCVVDISKILSPQIDRNQVDPHSPEMLDRSVLINRIRDAGFGLDMTSHRQFLELIDEISSKCTANDRPGCPVFELLAKRNTK